jgi:pyrroline-5-carboxylate reductase
VLDILLVGCGKMGSALVQGWQEHEICGELVIVDPASQPIKSYKEIPARFKPQVIVFAVKPQALDEIVPDYKSFTKINPLFISIAAGKPVSFFEAHLGASAKIIRSMPNTPAAIGKGITVAYANQHVSTAEKVRTKTLLGAVGDVLWVDKESLLNPVTALSGSGPAYIFLLIETLAKAGIRLGLAPAMAEKLARQTVIGSAALAEAEADISAAALRENVTSKGGTTEAALNILTAQPGIQELFDKALEAATKRAEELSG